MPFWPTAANRARLRLRYTSAHMSTIATERRQRYRCSIVIAAVCCICMATGYIAALPWFSSLKFRQTIVDMTISWHPNLQINQIMACTCDAANTVMRDRGEPLTACLLIPDLHWLMLYYPLLCCMHWMRPVTISPLSAHQHSL